MKIAELVRKAENQYTQNPTTISKYVEFDMYETLNTIDAYANSKHISGDKDSKGRDKPFFNIVTAAINIWYRATNISRKDLKIKATKSGDVVAAFIGTILLQDWMKKNNFGVFLNEWGRTLAKYGSAVSKFVEKDGKLHSRIVPWNTLIVDPINFEDNPKIEILQLTPAQLKQNKAYDQDVVERLIQTATTRELIDGQHQDNRDGYIKLYEIHGNLPLSYLTHDEEDKDTYVQQMHTISFLESEDGEYNDFCLVSGREAKDPYVISHLIEEPDRTLAIGAVEHLFQAQWMVNHSVKAIKDQLDLASKLFFQTADTNFVNKNALLAIETGDILVHEVNQPLAPVNNQSHDVSSLQSYASQWKGIGNENAGISETMLGAPPKAGTAWRQTEAILNENHSLFSLMTENKGLAVEYMLREFVLPNLKRKALNNSKELVATLENNNITKIDNMYVPIEVNKRIIQKMSKAMLKVPLEQMAVPNITREGVEQEVRGELAQMGNTRYFKPSDLTKKEWKEILEDLEWNVEVDITGEQRETQAHLTTLVTMFQTLMAQGDTESAKQIMDKILVITGALSPVELNERVQAQPQAKPPQMENLPATEG